MKLSIDRLLVSDAPLRKRGRSALPSYAPTRHDAFVFASAPDSAAANRYREICGDLVAGDASNKVLLVTSPGAAEGKTITAVNLAFAVAEQKKPVLLMELSLQRPRFRFVFGAPPNHPGVEQVLRGLIQPDAIVGELGNTGISLAGIGESLPMADELLAPGTHLNNLLDYAKSGFACTILDAPELTSSPHVKALAERVDEVVLVVRSGKTKATALRNTIRSLGQVRSSVVMNDFD
ncbi:CpsD/CapB family tyrosine-protein kinase [Silvibacterium acidisoli]|uniref:CpsD/CapB family tyrosine-protein kinase n=1 Tax=Acidobacteriaceae bacterium ZG23-2 TaxID=2883246 RepID=UPI00406CA9C9